MGKIKSYIQNKFSNRTILVVFLFACIVTSGFSFQYYNHLQSAIREESRGYLQEISQRIGSNISRIIDNNYAALYSIASVLETWGPKSFQEVEKTVEAQRQYWDFQDILLIDRTGRAYEPSGREIALNNNDYLDAIIQKQQGLSTTQMINNEERTLLMIPCGELTVEGKQMIALAASYDQRAFEQTLSMSSFSGEAYSCIITTEGTMVIRPQVSDSIKFGYNVLSTIEGDLSSSGVSMDSIKADIKADANGQITFSREGVRYYMVYNPIAKEHWYLLTFVPVQVVNEKSDMLLQTTLVICGLITVMFAVLMALLVVMSYRNKRRLEQIAYVDDITKGNTIQKFYELVQAALAVPDHTRFALVYTNIQKFKVLNEQFGRDACDSMLKVFYKYVALGLKNKECIGHLYADNFCILLEYESEEILLDRFKSWFASAQEYVDQEKPAWSLPITEFGVYVMDDDTVPLPQVIDRAKLALREFSSPVNSKLHYAIYNHETHKRLYREKQLEDMMETALQQNEFQVYLQPKYKIANQNIGGAEALARWVSSSEGMIYPNEFIPLFEKNGFIIQLDLWIFEQVCKRLRGWMDDGIEPVKISVNCSRVQLNNNNFLEKYAAIRDQYKIPAGLIEIELTESVVMEDVERLTAIINDIHELGFGCSMDDFGSGYSSLNLIKSIPVDTLKLDRIFFSGSALDSERTESVVKGIVSIANALSMVTVAEGIENREQVDMLARIGCDYIQGYVFAKPMPIAEFEALAFGIKAEEGEVSDAKKD